MGGPQWKAPELLGCRGFVDCSPLISCEGVRERHLSSYNANRQWESVQNSPLDMKKAGPDRPPGQSPRRGGAADTAYGSAEAHLKRILKLAPNARSDTQGPTLRQASFFLPDFCNKIGQEATYAPQQNGTVIRSPRPPARQNSLAIRCQSSSRS